MMEGAVVKNGRPAAARAVEAKFWEGMRSGLGVAEAGQAAAVSQEMAYRWFRQAGGGKSNGPRRAGGPGLSGGERGGSGGGRAGGGGGRGGAGRGGGGRARGGRGGGR